MYFMYMTLTILDSFTLDIRGVESTEKNGGGEGLGAESAQLQLARLTY